MNGWLCFNKTLFTKIGSEPDLPIPDLVEPGLVRIPYKNTANIRRLPIRDTDDNSFRRVQIITG